MFLNKSAPTKWRGTACVSLIAMLTSTMPISAQQRPQAIDNNSSGTRSPIKHVIVIIGENRTFDHIFATYKPATKGETVDNLLSKEIIREDGSPGSNYGVAVQNSAIDKHGDGYQVSPGGKSVYPKMIIHLAQAWR